MAITESSAAKADTNANESKDKEAVKAAPKRRASSAKSQGSHKTTSESKSTTSTKQTKTKVSASETKKASTKTAATTRSRSTAKKKAEPQEAQAPLLEGVVNSSLETSYDDTANDSKQTMPNVTKMNGNSLNMSSAPASKESKKSITDLDFNDRTLRRVNFANHLVKFDGFENFPNMPFSLYKDKGLGSIFKPFEDDSVCEAKFIYSLERIGSDKSQKKNLKAIMEQLYRICCDGALIEIRAALPQFLEESGDPTVVRSITENKLRFFDRDYAGRVLVADERLRLSVSDLHDINSQHNWNDIATNMDPEEERTVSYLSKLPNFKFIKSTKKLHPVLAEALSNSHFTSKEEVMNFIEQNSRFVLYNTYYLCVRKPQVNADAKASKDAHAEGLPSSDEPKELVSYNEFALCQTDEISSFIMRVHDISKYNMFVSRSLIQSGIWEVEETRLVTSFTRLIANLLGEVKIGNYGANLGWYSLIAAFSHPNVTVDAFEPTPETLEYLAHNVHLHKLGDRIKIYPYALSNKEENSKFYVDEDNDGSNSLMEYNRIDSRKPGHKVINVNCTTLDKIYLEKDVKEWPDFIVVDVEGHEGLLFEGSKGMFDKGYRPLIMVEFCPALLALRGDHCFYRQLLGDYGYSAFVVMTQSLVQQAREDGQLSDGLNIVPVDLEYLDNLYHNLSSGQNEAFYNDIIFVPDYFSCEDGKITLDSKNILEYKKKLSKAKKS